MTYKEFKERLEYLGVKDDTRLESFTIEESKFDLLIENELKSMQIINFMGRIGKSC